MAETPLLPAEDGAFGDSDESNDSHELMHLYYDEMPTFGVFDHDEFERFVARERAEAEAEEAGGTTSPDEDEAVGNPLARHACVFATFIIDVLALAAIGWVLYYEVGNYAVFLYGVALSTAQARRARARRALAAKRDGERRRSARERRARRGGFSARRSLPGAGAAAAPARIDERHRRRRRPRRSPSSRAQFAYSYYLYRQARERGDVTATWPNSLVAFVWWLCAIELVLWITLRSAAQRQWIVTWNGTIAGYATAVYWLSLGLVVENPSRTLEIINPDFLVKHPHVELTVRALLVWVGCCLVVTNTVGILLVKHCGANPNAPMWTNLATFAFNWDSLILIVLGAIVIRDTLSPRWQRQYPTRSFDEFLAERRRRRRIAAAAAALSERSHLYCCEDETLGWASAPAAAPVADEANPLAGASGVADAPAPAADAPPPPRSGALV